MDRGKMTILNEESMTKILESCERMIAMKRNKVLSDLRTLIEDIETKRVDIESYNYSFKYLGLCECEYDEDETGNEKITIEFSRNDVG